MKAKFDKLVYRALRDAGMSNREIAQHLDVNEASVRRALGKQTNIIEHKYLVTVTKLD